jgi:hypothetical protein
MSTYEIKMPSGRVEHCSKPGNCRRHGSGQNLGSVNRAASSEVASLGTKDQVLKAFDAALAQAASTDAPSVTAAARPRDTSDSFLLFSPQNYMPANSSVKLRQAETKGQLTKLLDNANGEQKKQIRHVIVDLPPKQITISQFEVKGPRDGRPVLVDYVSGYTSLKVSEGTAVIKATMRRGGGVDVASGASATIIPPAGKFGVRAEGNAKVIIIGTDGAWGNIFKDPEAEVEIITPPGAKHEFRITERSKRK